MTEGKDYYLVDKCKSKLMKLLSYVLFFNKNFMTNYVTTIGRTIYAPDKRINNSTLEHELQHVADYNRWGILFCLSYLLVLPVGWTMRAYWEKKAYAISIENVYKRNPTYARSQQYRDSIIRQFTGPDYLYMSFSKKNISRWFDETLTKVSNAS